MNAINENNELNAHNDINETNSLNMRKSSLFSFAIQKDFSEE